ncbi:FG-GAP repeat protein [Vibrio owensii]|uniref:FG-GAP repeat protein n=1 Tax=Vibrio owensii TaxID=696485 RepID=UPI0018F1F560|nr:FG-GAP repeat protein [Vibrio owensii]
MNKLMTTLALSVSMVLTGCHTSTSKVEKPVTPTPPATAEDLALSVVSNSGKQLTFEWTDIGADEYVLCREINAVCDEVAIIDPNAINVMAAESDVTTTNGEGLRLSHSYYVDSLLGANDTDVFYVRARSADTTLDSEELVLNYKEFNNIVGKYIPKQPVEWQNQGHVVAISGDGKTKAITTLTSGDPEVNGGEVTVYTRGDNGWVEVAVLKSPFTSADPITGFGVDLDIDDAGNTIAVGSWKQTVGGIAEAGAAYVFTKSEQGDWSDYKLIENPVPTLKDFFAASLSLSGNGKWLAIGAYNEDSSGTTIEAQLPIDDLSSNTGAVYLYGLNESNGAWEFAYTFKAPNADNNDFFGRKVRLSTEGDVLLSTANGEDSFTGQPEDNSVPSVGAGYVFRKQGDSSWAYEAYLKSPLPIKQSGFGDSAAISHSGDLIVLGVANEADTAAADPTGLVQYGAVHIWGFDGSTWVHQSRLKASNAEDGDGFGASVALGNNGTWLAVGARYEDSAGVGIDADQSDNSALNAGAAYIFELQGSWAQTHYVKSMNTTEKSFFGKSIAFSAIAKELAVSAPAELVGDQGAQVNAGIVYLY